MVYLSIMIADTLNRLSSHLAPADAQLIENFLLTLTPDIAAGDHPIKDRDIFASVSRYETKPRQAGYPEAHRRYADIQLLLAGSETIEWFTLGGLTERTPYDPGRDITFFERPDTPEGLVTLRPGLFVIFMPSDAHMPQLRAGVAGVAVTKIVIKVMAVLMDTKEE